MPVKGQIVNSVILAGRVDCCKYTTRLLYTKVDEDNGEAIGVSGQTLPTPDPEGHQNAMPTSGHTEVAP